jgi:hypothetical protein
MRLQSNEKFTAYIATLGSSRLLNGVTSELPTCYVTFRKSPVRMKLVHFKSAKVYCINYIITMVRLQGGRAMRMLDSVLGGGNLEVFKVRV